MFHLRNIGRKKVKAFIQKGHIYNNIIVYIMGSLHILGLHNIYIYIINLQTTKFFNLTLILFAPTDSILN